VFPQNFVHEGVDGGVCQTYQSFTSCLADFLQQLQAYMATLETRLIRQGTAFIASWPRWRHASLDKVWPFSRWRHASLDKVRPFLLHGHARDTPHQTRYGLSCAGDTPHQTRYGLSCFMATLETRLIRQGTAFLALGNASSDKVRPFLRWRHASSDKVQFKRGTKVQFLLTGASCSVILFISQMSLKWKWLFSLNKGNKVLMLTVVFLSLKHNGLTCYSMFAV